MKDNTRAPGNTLMIMIIIGSLFFVFGFVTWVNSRVYHGHRRAIVSLVYRFHGIRECASLACYLAAVTSGSGAPYQQGSSLLVMGVVGGAIVPLLYGMLSDYINPHMAYAILIPFYTYIVYFAASGSRIRTSPDALQ